jgi:hypothetical protein
MHYVIEWSRMDDATQFFILLFVAYIIASLLLITYVVRNAVMQAWRNMRRKRSMYYREYTK